MQETEAVIYWAAPYIGRYILVHDLDAKAYRRLASHRQMKFGLNIVANGGHAAGWRMQQPQADAACFHVMSRAD
jgi:hypothetical protein